MPLAYADFWTKLSPAYPVSNGSIRIPIIAEQQRLPIARSKLETELRSLTESLLAAGSTSVHERMREEGDSALIPLLSNEYTGIIRYDCYFRDNGSIAVLEVNTDFPDGLLLHDKTISVLTDQASTLHTDHFLSYFSPGDRVGVVYPKDAGFVDEYALEKVTLQNAGYEVEFGRTDALGSHDGAVTVNGLAVTVIRRCFESRRLSDAEQLRIASGSNTRFVNTWDMRSLGYKSLLSKCEHPAIPKTVTLCHKSAALAKSNKNNWVLKPSNLFEGRGVVLGVDVDQSDWEVALENALTHGNFILQEYVLPLRVSVPIYVNNQIVTKELYADCAPHVFVTKGLITGFGHVLMRASESKILNIAHGGALGYWDAQ